MKNNKYIYSYTDHLGNVRLRYFKNTNGSAEVLEENNYYPFGLKHTGYNALAGNPSYLYQYNGKELQEETGWNDYGARMYMADIARWGVIDPMAEVTPDLSPYHYANNNPLMYNDPTGMLSMSFMNQLSSSSHGTTWYNTGTGFISTGGSAMDYDGNNINWGSSYTDMLMRSVGLGGYINADIPEIIMKGKGNKDNWNNNTNYGYNSYLLTSKITGALEGWNYDVNSANMGQYIMNSKASMETAAVERFLFLEIPISIAGGELFAVGWRATNVSRYICRPVGRLTNGLLKICFTEGTLVATEKGNKKIEDIKEGNLVWSYNEETDKKELKKVVKLSRNTSSSLVKIALNGTEITCTPEHPFYVNGSWIEAQDLTRGMLLTTLDGTTSPVESVSFLEEKVKVYNFEVEGNHNYYVSEKGILVHNNCEWLEATVGQAKNWISTEPGMQSVKAVDNIAGKLAKNDPFIFAEPIKVVEVEGKTFILNGHHRIEAAIKIGYEGLIPYQKIPASQISQHSGFSSIGELIKVFGH